jgi:hypothetical protein
MAILGDKKRFLVPEVGVPFLRPNKNLVYLNQNS